MKIATGIITYNPEINRLKMNIESIIAQTNLTIIIDNNSKNFEDIKKLADDYQIVLIANKENLGIAKALNQLFEYSQENNYQRVFTLDQDSICPSDIIEKFSRFTEDNVGMICPITKYENINNKEFHLRDDFHEVDWCITSACLTKVKVWQQVGGFDESLFIDLVDYDFSIRVRQQGYKIIQDQNVAIKHELGNLEERALGQKKVLVGNHNPVRHYYYVRNTAYLRRKKILGLSDSIKRIVKLYCRTILFENQKVKKIKYMNKGVIEGVRMKIIEERDNNDN
ncbi:MULTISPECIES: glycosyltransferase family 2 protein [Enterococcus]|uniref:glycosyltransferase family 2 protein n=1 Tax=Enterococcus TaxID=1350 RepID=UPI00032E0D85|nr:glycosyltransferase family 2 protein [Enterococcus faecium]EOG34544.1 hypothetical protein SMS_02128 [Enterococcus faecium EnGen0184]